MLFWLRETIIQGTVTYLTKKSTSLLTKNSVVNFSKLIIYRTEIAIMIIMKKKQHSIFFSLTSDLPGSWIPLHIPGR